MAILPLRDLDSVGVIIDVAAYNVPIKCFTTAMNVRSHEGKVLLYAENATASHGIQSDNQDLRDEQFVHKVHVDEGELEVLRRETTDVRGFASPTG